MDSLPNAASPCPGKPVARDIDLLAHFIALYCEAHHPAALRDMVIGHGRVGDYITPLAVTLCVDCKKLLLYAAARRILCPYDPKPSCKRCTTHCYRGDYRDRIRSVMKFSGMYLIRRGRLGLLKKYFF